MFCISIFLKIVDCEGAILYGGLSYI